MFNQIFVSYLSEKNCITTAQAREVLDVQKNTKIRIGTLAAEEKLMSEDQVRLVNRLQSSQNARFGDIAVQKGFLTKSQLDDLLDRQPKEHIILKQILCDKCYMTSEQVDIALDDFKGVLDVSDNDYQRLQNNDIESFIHKVAQIGAEEFLFGEFCKLFITILIRLIDKEVYIKKASQTNSPPALYVSTQKCTGQETHTFAFAASSSEAALKFAERYAKQTFGALNEDAEDSLTEFLNCIDGYLVSKLANAQKLDLDLCVPEYHDKLSVNKDTLVFPFSLPFGDFFLYLI